MSAFTHIPVLREAAITLLLPRQGGRYLDGTFGGGGYSRAILERADCTLFALDRDPAAALRARALAAEYAHKFHFYEGRISEIETLIGPACAGGKLDGAVFDLGLSSYQIDDAARGFSFKQDGPLDMRMGRNRTDAATLVNFCPESELADILYQFGEEKASRRIAKAIVARRGVKAFATTADLAGVIRSVVRPDKSGIDPATRSFQALRIAVNEELAEIEAALAQTAELLAAHGRLVVVSFHSLEDRIVKTFFARAAGRGPGVSRHDPSGFSPEAPPKFRLVNKSPIAPEAAEIARNPRARSARLRALERLAA